MELFCTLFCEEIAYNRLSTYHICYIPLFRTDSNKKKIIQYLLQQKGESTVTIYRIDQKFRIRELLLKEEIKIPREEKGCRKHLEAYYYNFKKRETDNLQRIFFVENISLDHWGSEATRI